MKRSNFFSHKLTVADNYISLLSRSCLSLPPCCLSSISGFRSRVLRHSIGADFPQQRPRACVFAHLRNASSSAVRETPRRSLIVLPVTLTSSQPSYSLHGPANLHQSILKASKRLHTSLASARLTVVDNVRPLPPKSLLFLRKRRFCKKTKRLFTDWTRLIGITTLTYYLLSHFQRFYCATLC